MVVASIIYGREVIARMGGASRQLISSYTVVSDVLGKLLIGKKQPYNYQSTDNN